MPSISNFVWYFFCIIYCKGKIIKSNTHRDFKKEYTKILLDRYGVINEIEGSIIYADTYDHDGEFEEGISFDTCEFSDINADEVYMGNIFYWIVGTKMVKGKKVESSDFRIRRFI